MEIWAYINSYWDIIELRCKLSASKVTQLEETDTVLGRTVQNTVEKSVL